MDKMKDLLRTTKSPELTSYSAALNADGVRSKGHTSWVKA